MKKSITALALMAAAMATPAIAGQGTGPVRDGIPKLSHVFIIMMENHGYSQVIGNPNMPWVNNYVAAVNHATNSCNSAVCTGNRLWDTAHARERT